MAPFGYGSDARGGIIWSSATGAILNSANNLRLGLVRTDADGNVDSTFVVGPRFHGTTGAVTGPDGTVYLADCEARDLAPNGSTFTRIYRIRPDGTLDQSYRSPGFDAVGRFMALQPDGRLLATSGGMN